MTARLNFACLPARQRIALMMQRLALGPATRADLAMTASIACSATTYYIRHLISLGWVRCIRDFKKSVGESNPALYELVEGTAIPEAPIRAPKVELLPTWRPSSDERRVTITKNWAPMPIPKQSPFSALGL